MQIIDNWKLEIPTLSKSIAMVLLVLNIIIPGFGTMFSACLGPKFNGLNILIGFLQLVFTFFLIGWIWSIWWGLLMVEKAETASAYNSGNPNYVNPNYNAPNNSL